MLNAVCGNKHIPVTSETIGAKEALDVNVAGGSISIGAAPSPTAANAYTWRYKSSAQEHKGIARAEAALFAQAYGNIDKSEASAVGSAVYYLQFYNSTTVPADGATADLELAIEHTNGITTTFNISAEMGRVYFSTGISWSLSSTQFTKTEIATNKAAITILGY
jgi:hypothetical protein